MRRYQDFRRLNGQHGVLPRLWAKGVGGIDIQGSDVENEFPQWFRGVGARFNWRHLGETTMARTWELIKFFAGLVAGPSKTV